jgi:UDP-N-acetylglucosamine 4,6-dehydratase
VRDRERLSQAMRGIDFVIHAAALKQVPAAEYNPMECIKTNIHGAENVILAAIDNQVDKVIALSTDKAANPINLYGATKLASDKLLVAANNMTGQTRRGSPSFATGMLSAHAGPSCHILRSCWRKVRISLPITDMRMTRFWITLQQGVDFVLKNFERMVGGEIFVPRIPSLRIVDLATAMAPGLAQRNVGIRPGEKIHEIMCPADDSHLTVEFDDHFVITPAITFQTMSSDYKSMRLVSRASQCPVSLNIIPATILTFSTLRKSKNLIRWQSYDSIRPPAHH